MKIKSKMLLSVVSSALLFSSVSAFAESYVSVLICNGLNSYDFVTKKGNPYTHLNPKNGIQLQPLQHDLAYTLTPSDPTNAYIISPSSSYSQANFISGTLSWETQYGTNQSPQADCADARYYSKLEYPLTSHLTITDKSTNDVIWEGTLTTYPETLSAMPNSVNVYSDIKKSVAKNPNDTIFFFTTPHQISAQR